MLDEIIKVQGMKPRIRWLYPSVLYLCIDISSLLFSSLLFSFFNVSFFLFSSLLFSSLFLTSIRLQSILVMIGKESLDARLTVALTVVSLAYFMALFTSVLKRRSRAVCLLFYNALNVRSVSLRDAVLFSETYSHQHTDRSVCQGCWFLCALISLFSVYSPGIKQY